MTLITLLICIMKQEIKSYQIKLNSKDKHLCKSKDVYIDESQQHLSLGGGIYSTVFISYYFNLFLIFIIKINFYNYNVKSPNIKSNIENPNDFLYSK